MKVSRGPYTAAITNKEIKFYYGTNLLISVTNISSGVIAFGTKVAEMLKLRPEDQELLEFVTEVSKALNVNESLFFNRIESISPRSLNSTSDIVTLVDSKRKSTTPVSTLDAFPLEDDFTVTSTPKSAEKAFRQMLEDLELYRTQYSAHTSVARTGTLNNNDLPW